jgi:4-hydroxythreonine-4-phosphate dehydrogenase
MANTPTRPRHDSGGPALAPLALTMGEPGGVGAEIAVHAWRALRQRGPVFFCIDDPERLAALGAPVRRIEGTGEARAAFPQAMPVLALGAPVEAAPGRADPRHVHVVLQSIELAVALALSREAAGVVTNPVQKETIAAVEPSFRGHTDYIAALARDAPLPSGYTRRGPLMMLAGPELRVVPITVHLPLKDVAASISKGSIVAAGETAAEALRLDFGIDRPRLAIAGLNPHAGDGALLGAEDRDIVHPAVEALRARGIEARGPLAADTMFHAEARRTYDAALCMYHDQALIPVKTLAFHETVNVTLGLPIVRTSPDHGTALDIAGKGVARPDSLIAAIRLAGEIAARRASVS